MSRRIENQTNITDKDLALRALTAAGMEHQVQGDRIYIKSGAMAGATVDLRTGMVSGDSDFGHTEDSLGVLRQYYSEALFKRECGRQGTVIDQRRVEANGDIVLNWHTA
jgi:hypothetical protein